MLLVEVSVSTHSDESEMAALVLVKGASATIDSVMWFMIQLARDG